MEGTLSSESVQAVLQGVRLVHPAVETVCCHSQVIPDGIIPQGVLGSTELEEIDWAQVQRQDPILSVVAILRSYLMELYHREFLGRLSLRK